MSELASNVLAGREGAFLGFFTTMHACMGGWLTYARVRVGCMND